MGVRGVPVRFGPKGVSWGMGVVGKVMFDEYGAFETIERLGDSFD